MHEMVLSDDRAEDNDVNVAVDDVSMYAIECLIRTCNFVKESYMGLHVTSLKTTLPYMGLDRLVPARETDAVIAAECLRLPCVC